MKSQLIAALSALLCVVVLTPNLTAGEDSTETRHQVKVVMTDSDSEGAEVIRLDGDELAVGESRQILTDSGKEVVITRQEEGFDITVDGEEIVVPSALDGGHGSHFVQKILAQSGLDGDERSVVMIGADGQKLDVHGSHNVIVEHLDEGVFISEDGETTKIDTEKIIEWTSKHPQMMGLAGSGLTEHLDSSGAFDDLSEEQRQRIVDAISSYKGSAHSATQVIVMDLDDENVH